jgi:predicted hydrolase (HD superfamily)
MVASLAVEAIMEARLSRDEDTRAMSGLLDDLDLEITNADLKVHGLEAEKILRVFGIVGRCNEGDRSPTRVFEVECARA